MRDHLDYLNVARNNAKYAKVSIKLKVLFTSSVTQKAYKVNHSQIASKYKFKSQFTFRCVRNVSNQALI